VEDGSVVELVTRLAAALPVLAAFGEADEVCDGLGCVFFEELGDDRAMFSPCEIERLVEWISL
jgi:hypothetical protein